MHNSRATLIAPWEFEETQSVRTGLFLKTVCRAATLHARLLNTLSLLEHIGSRKIMASCGRALDRDVLQHLAEETRHAFFFKRAAENVSGTPLGFSRGEVLALPQAKNYMDRLDAFIAKKARGTNAYVVTSLVVELRAVWFYKLYQQILGEAGSPLNLNSILAEENKHLTDLSSRTERLDIPLPTIMAFESERFAVLMDGLESAASAAA